MKYIDVQNVFPQPQQEGKEQIKLSDLPMSRLSLMYEKSKELESGWKTWPKKLT